MAQKRPGVMVVLAVAPAKEGKSKKAETQKRSGKARGARTRPRV